VTGSISRAQYAAVAEYYEFFPLVCLMSNYEADEELSKTCVSMLAMMGQALTLPRHIPVALQYVSKVSDRLSSAMAQASHCGGPGSIRDQVMLNFWRKKWNWGMFSPSTLDPPAPTILFLPPAASLKMD
jgi:hypothetical protein